MFICVLLAAGGVALEREERALTRLVRGLVSRERLVIEKGILAAGCSFVVAFAMLAGVSAFVTLDWSRVGLWLLALGLGALAFGALGVAIGALAREVRAASLLAFLLSLPLAFLALVPAGRWRSGSTTRSGWSRSCFPSRPPAGARRGRQRGLSLARGLAGPSRGSRRPVRRSRARGTRAWIDGRPGRAHPAKKVVTWKGHGLSTDAHAQTARHGRPARARARDRAARRPARAAAVRRRCRARPPPREPIAGMPGVERLSISAAVAEAREAAALGIAAVMLFGVPAEKDEHGSGAWDEEGVVQVATRAIKQALPELLVITDVCLCEYTTHGHCGVLREDGAVDNDATIELLARTAVSHARAGADLVAPSDMMDGRVGAISAGARRRGLLRDPDPRLLRQVRLGLLRAVPRGRGLRARVRRPAHLPDGSRQRPRGGARGAARRAGGRRHGDGQAGARLRRRDRAVKRATRLPVAAYNVSGEYAMVKAAAAAGYLDERATVLRDPHLPAPRRRRHDHLLPRKGRGPMAGRADDGARRPTPSARARGNRPRRAAARTARRCRSTTSTASCST